MMKLTNPDNNTTLWVNPMKITTIREVTDGEREETVGNEALNGNTIIFFIETNDSIDVAESPEVVDKMWHEEMAMLGFGACAR